MQKGRLCHLCLLKHFSDDHKIAPKQNGPRQLQQPCPSPRNLGFRPEVQAMTDKLQNLEEIIRITLLHSSGFILFKQNRNGELFLRFIQPGLTPVDTSFVV